MTLTRTSGDSSSRCSQLISAVCQFSVNSGWSRSRTRALNCTLRIKRFPFSTSRILARSESLSLQRIASYLESLRINPRAATMQAAISGRSPCTIRLRKSIVVWWVTGVRASATAESTRGATTSRPETAKRGFRGFSMCAICPSKPDDLFRPECPSTPIRCVQSAICLRSQCSLAHLPVVRRDGKSSP